MPYGFSDDDYHLMITRSQGQFGWKIRYNHEPHPVLTSDKLYFTAAEAADAGKSVLEDLRQGRTDHSSWQPDVDESPEA